MTVLHMARREPSNTDVPSNRKSLSGWGRSPHSTADVVTPRSVEEVVLAALGTEVWIPRGLGRSYGDAGQLAGGTVVDMTGLSHVHLDPDNGKVTAMGGASLGRILDLAIPEGWFLPVSPGTRHVTVGGAIASDVHGKNHHRDGSFGHHVESIELLTGDGRVLTTNTGSEAFSATVGGMGLTGIILRATFRMLPVQSPWMSVDTTSAPDLDSVMTELVEADGRHRYSVAWLDLSRQESARGIVMGADHAEAGEVPANGGSPRNRARLTVPHWAPRVVDRRTVPVFNRLWWMCAPSRETANLVSVDSFFYPLDAIENWNRLYGSRGFLQYQFVVPEGEEDTLEKVCALLSASRTPVALAVLKRMGPTKSDLLSFPLHGWTLAVDMPLGDSDLAGTLDHCDGMVAGVGGRVYLSKDSRLKPEALRDMYPELPRWQELRADLDPSRRLQSNLSRRLRLDP